MRVINYPRLNGTKGITTINRAPIQEEDFAYINNEKFNSVIGYSFNFEGGYANNRYDLGGETNFGITEGFVEEYKYALNSGMTKKLLEDGALSPKYT